MSVESSRRSNLIDVTYLQLHSMLCGHVEGVSSVQIAEYLSLRKEQLKNITQSFGKPTKASREKIESGSVTLPDGVALRVDKEFALAISSKFQIDEIEALILLRSFLYNEGLPASAEYTTTTSMIGELLEAITPFYFSERLSLLRVFIPLFRAKENESEPIHELSVNFLPIILSEPTKFVELILEEYVRKGSEDLPETAVGDPKTATQWAKQNLKEQLVLLEVLFWTMWGYVPCSGHLVAKIYEAAYSTNIGALQTNSTLLLDEESTQLQEDCAALWILITIEILELETVGDGDVSELSQEAELSEIYLSSPQCLIRLHELITSREDSQYACTRLAWTFVLARLSSANASKLFPSTYQPFFDLITFNQGQGRSYNKEREAIHKKMTKACLEAESGLFDLIMSLLTASPLFVTAAAWKTGSSVTDPNAIAFRSVLKGLLIALVELVPVEHIPNLDALFEVWVALFGRSESQSVTGICSQFWQTDWRHGIARRAILDVARSRFPIHVKPLVRLLRALTGAGFLDTDPLSTADHSEESEDLVEERVICNRYVLHYLLRLPSFSHAIPANGCTGAHPLYERQPERYGSVNASGGLTYVNLRPIRLPGGSTLPARSTGQLLSGDGGDHLVVCWQHEHNGWKIMLELLTDYIVRRRMHSSWGGAFQDVSFRRRESSQALSLRLEDIGVDLESTGDETIITDVLDLVRSVLQGSRLEAEQLMECLEEGDPVVAHTMIESQPPDLVQLTTMILEEALSRESNRSRTTLPSRLISSAMSVLAALLALPRYSNRVWLYIRSTNVLFGSEKVAGFTSVALSVERATGHYSMTLALLYLVQQLFREAASSILPDNARLQQLKEEVLLRAVRFLHTEIWIEHLGWKYAQLGDRFEIGKIVTSLYVEILEHAPPTLSERPFAALRQYVADVLVFKASMSSISPLVSSIGTGGQILRMLYASRRFGDARPLIFLLQSHLRLCRIVLNYKQKTNTTTSLLEQTLCGRVTGGTTPQGASRAKHNPIDVLTEYVKNRSVGTIVPLEAIRVLHALCGSLASVHPFNSSIIGHISEPESTVASLVRIIQHPYDDLCLRNAIWNFISLAVDTEPALASLFVTGNFHGPQEAGSNIPIMKLLSERSKTFVPANALDVAREMLASWKGLWEANPQLLCSVFRFLDVVWKHGLEHKVTLLPLRDDPDIWESIVSVIREEIGPVPDYEAIDTVHVEGLWHSSQSEPIAMHCYRTMVKSYAVHILALDIDIHLRLSGTESSKRPQSFLALQPHLKSQEQLTELLCEASPTSYAPSMNDILVACLQSHFPGLLLEQLEIQDPVSEREYGDNFMFSASLLWSRVQAYRDESESNSELKDSVMKQLLSINLNLSLAYAQVALTESWESMLRKASHYLRGEDESRPILLSIASSMSYDIAAERRSGDLMALIYEKRLSLLLVVLELAWFSKTDKESEVQSFVELVCNTQGIIVNEAQPPLKSILGVSSQPFHRVLFQIVYFCIRQTRNMIDRPKLLHADHRLTVASMVEATFSLVIDALRIVFISARSRHDVDLDKDMNLLVTLFEQCTRRDISPSSTQWLSRCQEMNVIRASLDLYSHIDLVGLSDLPLLVSRKQPLYGPHILLFHMALVSNSTAAERFASEGALSAYSNNFISAAISAGMITVTLPELPGYRSPAHLAYVSMVSVVTSVISALGRQNHYFDSEACGFVQLYGDQIARALSWTIGDAITLPLVEEMEQVVNLFYSIAESIPAAANSNPTVEKVLRVFTIHSLRLLQQINYAVAHPHHLASFFEPLTREERALFEGDPTPADPLKRPIIAHLVHRLFKLSSNIVGTLVACSRADTVLLGVQEDWPLSETVLVPHSKIILGEPASLGTLLELGNCALDLLRDLVHRAAPPITAKLSALTGTYTDPLDVKQGVVMARKNLEGMLLYSVTQLAMWLSKPEFDGAPPDADTDHEHSTDLERVDVGRERRGPRQSVSVAERVRRGMSSEVARDLLSLLNKSKPIIAKTNSIFGKNSVDLTPILLNFLRDRISVAP